VGDLDSLRDDVSKYYVSHGTSIEEDGDQYSTDFGKAVRVLTRDIYIDEPYPENPQRVDRKETSKDVKQDIVILGTIAGRVDQGIGLLHEIYREYLRHEGRVQFWLVSEQNISFLLPPGTNVLKGINPKVRTFPHHIHPVIYISIFPVLFFLQNSLASNNQLSLISSRKMLAFYPSIPLPSLRLAVWSGTFQNGRLKWVEWSVRVIISWVTR
jgi:hypothetical protein